LAAAKWKPGCVAAPQKMEHRSVLSFENACVVHALKGGECLIDIIDIDHLWETDNFIQRESSTINRLNRNSDLNYIVLKAINHVREICNCSAEFSSITTLFSLSAPPSWTIASVAKRANKIFVAVADTETAFMDRIRAFSWDD
jgi:hypothetical protein